MPGVGKSYWAEQIAAHYALQCIDLDNIIEVRSGMSIGTFFERFGEAEFRKLEQLTLTQIQEVFSSNCIIACGGGTPCFFDNLAKMKAKGKVIYLKANINFLVKNLEAEHQKRPLLNNNNRQEEIAAILETRRSFYEQADFIVSAESLTVKYFQTIINALR